MQSPHLLQVSLVYVNTLMIQQVLARPEWHGRLTAVDLQAALGAEVAACEPLWNVHPEHA